MKRISFVILMWLVATFLSLIPIEAFAADSIINGIRYYWTGYEEIPGDDVHHHRLGYFYYPQNSISAKKINTSVLDAHHYSNHHICANCGHICSHADVTYVEAKFPSCTEPGNVAYWKCPGCKGCFSDQAAENELLSDSVVLEPLGHDYKLGVCTHCHEGDGINGFNGSCGDTAFYWINSAGEMHVYGSGSMMDFDSISPSPWSSHLDIIKNVIIEEGIVSIGNQAFADCGNMMSVIIPHGILHIGDRSFTNCALLSDIYYNGREMDWHTITIGDNNEKLTNASLHCRYGITINNGIVGGSVTATVEGEEVIEAIDGTPVALTIVPPTGYELKTLSVKQGETEIAVENNCFTMPAGDVDVMAIFHVTGIWGRVNWSLNSNGLLSISGNGKMVGFSRMSQDAWHAYSPDIRTVEVESGITSIGNYAFYACNETTDIFIASDVSNIGEYAFSDCSSLKNLTMPSNVMSIGSGAFQNCTSLVSFTIPKEIATINNYTFSGCNNMKHMSIPLGVKHIGEGASQGCSALTDVFYYGSLEQWNEITIEDDNDFLTCADIHCVTTPDFMLPASLTTIEDEAFVGGAFSYVMLPEQTVSIGWHAFAECPNLMYIFIPETTISIDRYAFADVNGLTIIGKSGSEAESFANKNNFTFVAIS